MFLLQSLRVRSRSLTHVICITSFSLIILHFLCSAELPAAGTERQALGVRGGADAAPAAGGARELPAGPAPVQLSAPVPRLLLSVQIPPVL